jgi:hypothetical protein
MTYSINVSGHANKATKEETAEEGRKFVKALDGVSVATLNWSLGADQEAIDLTKPAQPADADGDANKGDKAPA